MHRCFFSFIYLFVFFKISISSYFIFCQQHLQKMIRWIESRENGRKESRASRARSDIIIGGGENAAAAEGLTKDLTSRLLG